jgi:hypothetical protein
MQIRVSSLHDAFSGAGVGRIEVGPVRCGRGRGLPAQCGGSAYGSSHGGELPVQQGVAAASLRRGTVGAARSGRGKRVRGGESVRRVCGRERAAGHGRCARWGHGGAQPDAARQTCNRQARGEERPARRGGVAGSGRRGEVGPR